MKMRSVYGMILFSVAMCLCLPARSQPVLNYQGRVAVNGSPHNEDGWFKFALVDGGGNFVWASDGSLGPDEPGSAVELPVNNGLFSADLGNVSLFGMNAIPPLALHAPNLSLRVWFSHDGSFFERLEPDTPVRPMDFSQFNTGRMIVVDMDGRGDYGSLQDAINRVADDGNYDAVLVMPGHYEESITIPDFKDRITIRGAANASAVQLWNSGPTLTLGQGTEVILENLMISGNPALTGTSGQIILRQCDLFPDSHESDSPVVALSEDSRMTLIDSAISHHGTKVALQISGNVFLQADRASFFSNGHAVEVVGGHPNAHFRNCQFQSHNATTFLLQDAPGWVTIENSQFHANNASAIEMIATSEIALGEQDNWNITLRSSTVSVHGDSETAPPAIRLDNQYSEDLELEIELISCDIMGRRDGIELSSGSMLFAHYSMIEGDRYGVYAPDGDAEVELIKCQVFGAQDLPGAGIFMGEDGFVFMQGSEVIGEENGSGIVLNFTDEGAALLMQSTIGGMGGNALAVNGGIVHANQSTFFSVAEPTLLLGGADANHRFNHCTFKSVAELFDDDDDEEPNGPELNKPAVLIAGAQDQTPVPTFFACSFEPALDADHSIELETATSGNIVLINSVLGKALGAEIVNSAPMPDNWGNVIFTP